MKNASGIVKVYALFSQGLMSILILGGIGFFIGWKVNKHSALSGILAVVGGIIGFVIFISLMLRYLNGDELNKITKESTNNDENSSLESLEDKEGDINE